MYFLEGLVSCARARFIMPHELEEAGHGIIRTLESVLFPNIKPHSKEQQVGKKGGEEIMENNYPCSSCVHNTYEPGYYVDRSLMCFYCSVYDPKQKYSQYSKVANKERQKVLNDLYGITDTLKYTTSSASTTFTLNDFHKAKALLDDIGDPWKELFERYGFSMERMF